MALNLSQYSPDQLATPTSETSIAESAGNMAAAFVASFDFQTASNDVVFTTSGNYANTKALFTLAVDDVTGSTAPTATAFADLPDGYEAYTQVQTDRLGASYLCLAQMVHGSRDEPGGVRSDLVAVSAGGSPTVLTSGQTAPVLFATGAATSTLVFVDEAGGVYSANPATGIGQLILSDVFTAAGFPGAPLSLSTTGRYLALSTVPDYSSASLDLTDLSTGATTTLTTIARDSTQPVLSRAVFDAADDLVYYVVSRIAGGTNGTDAAFSNILYEAQLDPPAAPVAVVDLAALTGDTETRVSALYWAPDTSSIVYLSGSSIVGFTPATQTAQTLSLPGEYVVEGPRVTSVAGTDWVGYLVAEDVNPATTPYYDRDGAAVATISTVRVVRLP